MTVLKSGSTGPQVTALQEQLQQRGFDPGQITATFGPSTEEALRSFQQSVGLEPDGVLGPNTIAALKLPSLSSNVTVECVLPMFPQTPRVNIQVHLPFVLKALLDAQLTDKNMVLMALATIRAEAASFQPIDEIVSPFNTPPSGPAFALYDHRADLGNQGPGDGADFKGRGFVQLTGRTNYAHFSRALGLGSQLVDDPELANDPQIAAQLLAAFLKGNEDRIRSALAANDLATARKLVNGGAQGLPDFKDAFQRGQGAIPESVSVASG
jgi:hypothetical protein